MSAGLKPFLAALGRELGTLPGACCVIVAGSVSRGEASVLDTASGAVLLGDVDTMLVVRRLLPGHSIDQAVARALSSTVGFSQPPSVQVGQVRVRQLAGLQRKLFVYEMREAGQCIFGPDLRAALPKIDLATLDRAELNEIYIHRLEALLKAHSPEASSRNRWYAVARNTLDITTWLLPIDGVLLPTYGKRAAFLMAHPDTPFLSAMPRDFAERLVRYTTWKLDPANVPSEGDAPLAECLEDFDAAMRYAQRAQQNQILRRYSRRRRVLRAALVAFRETFRRRTSPIAATRWVARNTLRDRARLARTVLGWIAGEPRTEATEAMARRLLDVICLVPISPPSSVEAWRCAVLDSYDVHREMA